MFRCLYTGTHNLGREMSGVGVVVLARLETIHVIMAVTKRLNTVTPLLSLTDLLSPHLPIIATLSYYRQLTYFRQLTYYRHSDLLSPTANVPHTAVGAF